MSVDSNIIISNFENTNKNIFIGNIENERYMLLYNNNEKVSSLPIKLLDLSSTEILYRSSMPPKNQFMHKSDIYIKSRLDNGDKIYLMYNNNLYYLKKYNRGYKAYNKNGNTIDSAVQITNGLTVPGYIEIGGITGVPSNKRLYIGLHSVTNIPFMVEEIAQLDNPKTLEEELIHISVIEQIYKNKKDQGEFYFINDENNFNTNNEIEIFYKGEQFIINKNNNITKTNFFGENIVLNYNINKFDINNPDNLLFPGIYTSTIEDINAIQINSLEYDNSHVNLFLQYENNTNINLNDYNILSDSLYINENYKLYGCRNIELNSSKQHHNNNINFRCAYLNNDISNKYIINFNQTKNIYFKLIIGNNSINCNINIKPVYSDTLIIPSNGSDATNILNDVSEHANNKDRNNKLKASIKNRITNKQLYKYFKMNNDILDLKYKFNTYTIIKHSEKYNLNRLSYEEAIYAVFDNNDYIDLVINDKNIRIIRNDKIDESSNLLESYDISNIDNLDITLSNNDNYVYYPGEEVVINNRLFTFGSFEGGGFIPNTNICFYPGTVIKTDQGNCFIENLDSDYHTINNEKIIGISHTTYPSNLVCFSKHSLGYNVPNKPLIVTDNHLIYYNDKLIKAGDFAINYIKVNNIYSIKNSSGIYFVKNNKKILYNIVMDKHNIIKANNMLCETLHPDNLINQIYNIKNIKYKNFMFKTMNKLLENNKYKIY